MRRIAAAFALLLGCAGLAVPASADAYDFELRGKTSGWVDLKIRDVDGSQQITDVRIATNGRFGGFYVRPVAPTRSGYPHTYGELLIRDLVPTGGRPAPIRLGTSPQLDPGVVRVYLIADGETTVRFRTTRPIGRKLTTRHRVHAGLSLGPLKRTGDAWVRETPVTMTDKTYAMAALVAQATLPSAADPELCVGPADTPCDAPAGPVGGEQANDRAVHESDAARRWVVQFMPFPRHGEHAARLSVSHPLGITRAVGAVFTLTAV